MEKAYAFILIIIIFVIVVGLWEALYRVMEINIAWSHYKCHYFIQWSGKCNSESYCAATQHLVFSVLAAVTWVHLGATVSADSPEELLSTLAKGLAVIPSGQKLHALIRWRYRQN